MLFDILTAILVSFISSLFLCSTSVDSLPSSPTIHHLIRRSPSADLSSSLRLSNHRPVASVDNDLGGDISSMLFGESNEEDHSFLSPTDLSNDPFEYYLQPSKFLSRNLLLLPTQHQQKRSSLSSFKTQFNSNSPVLASADSFNGNKVIDANQLNEPIRLSPSLTALVEKNPLARMWLTMLLEKLMKEKPAPYIFKYGRRRK
jgi:hypothetical protein